MRRLPQAAPQYHRSGRPWKLGSQDPRNPAKSPVLSRFPSLNLPVYRRSRRSAHLTATVASCIILARSCRVNPLFFPSAQPARHAGEIKLALSMLVMDSLPPQRSCPGSKFTTQRKSIVLEAYRKHVEERAAEGVPAKPLDAEQVAGLVELLKSPPAGEEQTLVDLITHRVPPGVDEAAYVKAAFLSAIIKGEASSPLIDKPHAIERLGMMLGGYNIETLVDLLDDAELAPLAGEQLKHTRLRFGALHYGAANAAPGNVPAKHVLQPRADGEWLAKKDEVPESIKLTLVKVPRETTPDALSPAQDPWSRPDIPLHARAMYKRAR